MKITRVALRLWFAGPTIWAAPPSAEDFARPPEFSNIQLSPDGKLAAVLHHESRGGALVIWDSVQKKTTRFESWAVFDGDGTRSSAGLRDYRWLTGSRMFFRTEGSFFNDYTYADAYRANVEAAIQSVDLPANVSRDDYRTRVLMNNSGPLMMAESSLTQRLAVSGFFAADRNGQNRIELPGVDKDAAQGGDAYFIWNPATLQVSRRYPGSVFMAYAREAWRGHPHLGRFETETGSVKIAAENPGNVDEWLLDWDEQARLGIVQTATTTKLWSNAGGTKKWSELADLGVPATQLVLHGFNSTGMILHASRVEPGGNWALYTYSLAARQWSREPALRNARIDITPGNAKLAFAEADLTAPVFSARQRDLIGVRYVAERPRQIWFDARMAAAQRTLDAKLPGKVNMILGMNEAENRFAVLSWSARDPGSYAVFDEATAEVVRLAQRMPWLKPEEMGDTVPFDCRASDGLVLSGYITKPPGSAAVALPLVVLLREQPWQRDVWGFDPWVQFLATRGYAVLQVNYRGSLGYGPAFHEKGMAEVGQAIQTDIAAAVAWAIQAKIADPDRIAVVGRSFGGTCALAELGRDSAHYRCGVAIAAVTDWPEIFQNKRDAARHYWVETAGLFPENVDRERLQRISPITFADRITAPVLLVHGITTAPVGAAKAMAAALEKTGHKPETFFYAPGGGPAGAEKDNVAIFQRLETFLAAHMAAAPATATK